MSISRRYFFFGTLLAGAVPPGGFGTAQSLQRLGYKSPNEKLNIAGIGAGGRPFADLVASEASVENIVALTDLDWERGAPGFNRWPQAEEHPGTPPVRCTGCRPASMFTSKSPGPARRGKPGFLPKPPKNTKSPLRWATRA